MASFTIWLSKSLFVIRAKGMPGCVHRICEPCPWPQVVLFLEPSLLPHIPSLVHPWLTVPLVSMLGPPGLFRLWSCVSELWARWQPKLCEHRPWGVGPQKWQWARETFMAREGPPVPVQWKSVLEYVHILLIKPTQKRQHCNIFQWLFIMNYVTLCLNCYYFSLMLLGACIIYSIGS